ncbi:hypothetical protein J2Z18_004593 [Paenibacillus lactis]|uniref:Uncharacterized protein n=2 Tax=Paenibacillus lactis TaxID=228574 RepID=G4HJ57_9BACL|nr:hypothetical protein PaelaDRAFT_4018 [Paenibacillus lactis 154]MBP1895483.1 hypothetical protein [Paenibacillus lactis]
MPGMPVYIVRTMRGLEYARMAVAYEIIPHTLFLLTRICPSCFPF